MTWRGQNSRGVREAANQRVEVSDIIRKPGRKSRRNSRSDQRSLWHQRIDGTWKDYYEAQIEGHKQGKNNVFKSAWGGDTLRGILVTLVSRGGVLEIARGGNCHPLKKLGVIGLLARTVREVVDMAKIGGEVSVALPPRERVDLTLQREEGREERVPGNGGRHS